MCAKIKKKLELTMRSVHACGRKQSRPVISISSARQSSLLFFLPRSAWVKKRDGFVHAATGDACLFREKKLPHRIHERVWSEKKNGAALKLSSDRHSSLDEKRFSFILDITVYLNQYSWEPDEWYEIFTIYLWDSKLFDILCTVHDILNVNAISDFSLHSGV